MTTCICGHDIAKHSNQGCMAIIDVSDDKFCPCELTRMDVIKASAESAEARAAQLEARVEGLDRGLSKSDEIIAQLEAERDAERKERESLYPVIDEKNRVNKLLRADVIRLESERDAFAAENDAIHRAVNEMCGTNTSTIEAVKQIIDERDDLNIRLKSWHDSAMTVADQRDAAYKRNTELEAERDEQFEMNVRLLQENIELKGQLKQARRWARVWKLAAKWHNLSAVISFGE